MLYFYKGFAKLWARFAIQYLTLKPRRPHDKKTVLNHEFLF